MVHTPPAAHAAPSHRFSWKTVLILVLFLAFLYAVLPRSGEFRHTGAVLGRANLSYLTLAFAAMQATYLAAALVYKALSLRHRLPLGRLVLVQYGGMFANRLLPAGIGAIGVNYAFLRRRRFSAVAAASLVAINNLLGMIAHGVLLLVVLSAIGSQHILPQLRADKVLPLLALLLLLSLLGWRLHRRSKRLMKFARGIWRETAGYARYKRRLVYGLICAGSLTVLYCIVLAFCAQAVGVHLPVAKVFIVLTASVLGTTVTPTPGGLIGAEAVLVAAFTAYGVSAADGLAVALLYRGITFWLPLVLGSGAFTYLVRRGDVGSKI